MPVDTVRHSYRVLLENSKTTSPIYSEALKTENVNFFAVARNPADRNSSPWPQPQQVLTNAQRAYCAQKGAPNCPKTNAAVFPRALRVPSRSMLSLCRSRL